LSARANQRNLGEAQGAALLEREDRTGTVERLLQEGVDLYQSGLVDHAVAVWTEVLHVLPNEPRALEYLRQASVDADAPEPSAPTEQLA
jgi:hypothetical protein